MAKEQRLKEQFAKLDANGDGTLDFDELKGLLKKGNPSFKDNDVRSLYDKCDANGDGKISFDEFLAYVYGSSKTSSGAEGDWGEVEVTFSAFCAHGHKDMEGKEWAKLCKDCSLLGHGFQKTDVDLIFAKVVPKGKRRMDFNQFQEACRQVAVKRKEDVATVQDKVKGSSGPHLSGTKADYVRFNDDKSTFTGSHCYNTNFDGVDPNAAHGRHERQQAEAAAGLQAAGAEDSWDDCKEAFDSFAGPGGELDGAELMKMVVDVKLLGGGLTKQDVDICFTSVARKAKKINFEHFQELVRSMAKKKNSDVATVQRKIAVGRKVLHGTETEAVRFHDDKSTYTGAHADVHGREGGHGGDRHAELAEKHAAAAGDAANERPWDEAMEKFYAFGGADGLDGREFMKFCKEANLIKGGFTNTHVDLVFSSVVPKGQRKLDDEMFKQAVREIAIKQGKPTSDVQGQVAMASGPAFKGTAGESRFHDDKTTYTGSHVGK